MSNKPADPELSDFLNEVNKDTAARTSSTATAANATAAPLATPPAGDTPAPAGAIDPPEPIRLITFPRPKYAEQAVALTSGDGLINIELFDAVRLFIDNEGLSDTLVNRGQVLKQTRAWAEQFVAQMNAGAKLAQIEQALQRHHMRLNAREHGDISQYRFVDDVEATLNQPWTPKP